MLVTVGLASVAWSDDGLPTAGGVRRPTLMLSVTPEYESPLRIGEAFYIKGGSTWTFMNFAPDGYPSIEFSIPRQLCLRSFNDNEPIMCEVPADVATGTKFTLAPGEQKSFEVPFYGKVSRFPPSEAVVMAVKIDDELLLLTARGEPAEEAPDGSADQDNGPDEPNEAGADDQ